MNGGVVSHESKLLSKVQKSTTTAESSELARCADEVQALRVLLGELGVRLTEPTIIYEDNLAAVQLVNGDAKLQHRTKTVLLQLARLREQIDDGIICVLPVLTDHNIADLGTKSLPRPAFKIASRCTTVPFIP